MPKNSDRVLFTDADSYSANSKLQYDASIRFIQSFELSGTERVLDIGCGDGRISSYLADNLPKGSVTAIDNSPAMIELAKKRNQQPNLEFLCLDAQSISLPKKFDLIVSTFCFHWLIDKPKALRIIGQHLEDHGRLMFIMPMQHVQIAKIRADLMSASKWKKYFIDYQDPAACVADSKYDEYAEIAGLDNITVSYETVTTEYKSRHELLKFLMNITPCIKQLPHIELQQEFMDELVDSYLSANAQSEEGVCSISYTYVKLLSIGIKKEFLSFR